MGTFWISEKEMIFNILEKKAKRKLKGGSNEVTNMKKDEMHKSSAVKKSVRKKRNFKPRAAGIVVGKKSFTDPKEVTAFYRAEAVKMKQAMNRFKIEQVEGQLSVAKDTFMKIMLQKKKLNDIADDLDAHTKVLMGKISDIGMTKEEQVGHEKSVKEFVQKMKVLEGEAKGLQDTREQLIADETKLIMQMKDLVKVSKSKIDLVDLKSTEKLRQFEESKESQVMRARNLLSSEMSLMFSDSSLLENLNDKSHKKLIVLNDKLAKIHGDKKETLKRKHLLEISEKDVESKLALAKQKVKTLEAKYHTLLKN